MIAINYTTLRNNLKTYCDKVTEDFETVIITRKDEDNVVMISLEEYNAMKTVCNNLEFLFKIDRSIEQIEQGRVINRTLEELEEMAK